MTSVQERLDQLRLQNDNRTSLFDIQIEGTQNGTLILSGRLLDESQLKTLAHQFPGLKLDTASIRILSRTDLPRMHVATNVTGLYERPTFGRPLSSELHYGTELEILDEQGRWAFTRQKDGYLGWAYKAYLAEGAATKATHLVLAPSYELRAGPDRASEIVTRVVGGTGVILEETGGEWAKVMGNKTGWMPLSLLRAVGDLPKTIQEKRKMLDAYMQHAAAKPVGPPFEAGDLFFFAENYGRRKITHMGMSLGGWMMIHSSRGRNGVYIDDLRERESLRETYVSAGSFLRPG